MGLTRPRRSRRLWRRFGVAAAVACLAWVLGLLDFAARIPNRVVDRTTTTDAIIVLTGGSDRLQEGLRLLAEAKAGRLLISGVNAQVSVDELLQTVNLPPAEMPRTEQIACCITLGHIAANTAGNARETAAWMAANGLASLRLVTADYHMPRSLVEFAMAMPAATIVPHPVFPAHVKSREWLLWPGTASLIVNEYHKYLVAVLRSWLRAALYGEDGDGR